LSTRRASRLDMFLDHRPDEVDRHTPLVQICRYGMGLLVWLAGELHHPEWNGEFTFYRTSSSPIRSCSICGPPCRSRTIKAALPDDSKTQQLMAHAVVAGAGAFAVREMIYNGSAGVQLAGHAASSGWGGSAWPYMFAANYFSQHRPCGLHAVIVGVLVALLRPR